MPRSYQLRLPTIERQRLVHGGELSIGKRKTSRPLSTKLPMHFVLRSSLAKGAWSFLHPRQAKFIRELVPSLAKRYGVRLYQWSQNGNHLHLLLKAESKAGLKTFLMVLAGRISMRITGSKKGKALGNRFFDSIPFSRIAAWGKAFVVTKNYVHQNILEVSGEISYIPRGKKLAPR